jgi:uncharacterized protein YecT (DUF1311 family)
LAIDMTRPLHALCLLLTLCGGAAHALDCNNATTQADMNTCAYDDFLAANAVQAAALKAYSAGLSTADRARWRAAQRAWLDWRSAHCAFESGAAAGGSAREMLRWRCAARLTRERTAAIGQLAHCAEGDLACPARKP